MNDFILDEGFISEAVESSLVALIRAAMRFECPPAGSQGERSRILRYGWSYHPANRWLQEIPTWLKLLQIPLGDNAVAYDSVTVNEYQRSDGIAPHIDSLEFGPTIAVLSLLSGSELVFRFPGGSIQQHIPARALYRMSGPARQLWTHEILPVEQLRYSLVFRSRASRH